MSTATTTRPAPGARSQIFQMPILRFWGSSVGLKLIMAGTGVGLSGFVLVHMLGNLQIFQGAEALDAYGHLLHAEPAVLWGARVALLTMVGLHIWSFLVLTGKIWKAQPKVVGHRPRHRNSTWASRSMRISGPLLLAFIIYHILHLTTGTVHPDYHEGSVYANLVSGLEVPLVATVYIASMALLGLHLWHGTWSLFQTLGADQGRYESLGRNFATLFTVVVILGFVAVPVAVTTGIVKPAPFKQTAENGRQFEANGTARNANAGKAAKSTKGSRSQGAGSARGTAP